MNRVSVFLWEVDIDSVLSTIILAAALCSLCSSATSSPTSLQASAPISSLDSSPVSWHHYHISTNLIRNSIIGLGLTDLASSGISAALSLQTTTATDWSLHKKNSVFNIKTKLKWDPNVNFDPHLSWLSKLSKRIMQRAWKVRFIWHYYSFWMRMVKTES